jgi:hypothetical protein
VPFDTAKHLHLEIQLMPADLTEGKYAVSEGVFVHEKLVGELKRAGSYNIFTNDHGQQILVLQNSARETTLRRTYLSQAGNVVEENFRNTDLSFYVEENRLKLLDGDWEIKRTTRLTLKLLLTASTAP